MRLKTFVSTYLLIVVILFSSLSIISVYMNNSQMNMLTGQGEREFRRISATLARDITFLYNIRAAGAGPPFGFAESVEQLMRDYARYYMEHGITIYLEDLSPAPQSAIMPASTEIAFVEHGNAIHITGVLAGPLQYRLNFYLDISENVENMRDIQRVLLIFFVVFAVISAFALYFILLRIFIPLDVIAGTSRKIADEHYGERIYVKGNNELAAVAGDFNRMADKIENQIRLLEEEAAAKQQFIDNFAHEIRTPLTSIYGNAEYLQKAVLEEGENVQLTQSIMNRTRDMKTIANSLLQLAVLRNYTPVKTQINVQQLFEDIAQTVKVPIAQHNVRFVFTNSVDVLLGQEDLIKSLLLNLCFNGIKACSFKGGVVLLEAEQQNDSIVLTVTDNGCGIPDESIERVTEPFYRVDKSRNRSLGGAGLGLTLCRQIAEVHGAQMIIESSVGAGTTVQIIFPL